MDTWNPSGRWSEGRLRRRPETDEILAEAKAHLEEGIEELVGRGMTRQAAEETIMARFGAADAVCKWYAELHRRPSVWRASRWPLVALALLFLLMNLQAFVFHFDFLLGGGQLVLYNGMLAVTIVLCYRSKRFTSGVVALATGTLFLVTLTAFCFFSVPIKWEHGSSAVARWSVPSLINDAQARMVMNERQLADLESGRETFTPEHEPAEGVGMFHDSRGYWSSIFIEGRDARVRTFFGNREVNGIFPTYEEARHFWMSEPSRYSEATGNEEPAYLAGVKEELAQDRNIVLTAANAESLPFGVKLPVFVMTAWYPSIFLLGLGVIADISGGLLRMLVQLIRKLRRRSPGEIRTPFSPLGE